MFHLGLAGHVCLPKDPHQVCKNKMKTFSKSQRLLVNNNFIY